MKTLRPRLSAILALCLALCLAPGTAAAANDSAATDDLLERVEHRFAENDGVKIHYVTLGQGPLVVMIHGFPDYWYSWRHQMEVLAHDYTVVAMDMRGYNRSDSPEGVDHYAMANLIGDVAAVVAHTEHETATIVGHDWGAAVAWNVALYRPEIVERLVVLSVPHPAGFSREVTTNASQKADSQYARDFQKADSHLALTAEGLAGWVQSAEARAHYVEAFERSSFDAMMNYYRKNYPGTSAASAAPASAPRALPRIACPVLVLHGLKDRYLHASGHNGTWEWIDADTTLVMLPEAGHFVQHDESEKVSITILDWLAR